MASYSAPQPQWPLVLSFEGDNTPQRIKLKVISNMEKGVDRYGMQFHVDEDQWVHVDVLMFCSFRELLHKIKDALWSVSYGRVKIWMMVYRYRRRTYGLEFRPHYITNEDSCTKMWRNISGYPYEDYLGGPQVGVLVREEGIVDNDLGEALYHYEASLGAI